MPLTVLEVQKAKPREKQYKMSDGQGLYLLVDTKGRKYWRMKYYFANRERVYSIGVYPDVMHLCLAADNGNMFTTDLLANAAINRSMSNINGFAAAFKSDNYILASSIIRLQLDTLLRFYALHLVDKPEQLSSDILQGKELRKIKDRDNQLLTDSYLCKKFAQANNMPWVIEVYKGTSGYIHLSQRHVYVTLNTRDGHENEFQMTINGKAEHVPEMIKKAALECMLHVSQLLVEHIYGWVLTKRNFAARRAAHYA